MRGTDLDRVFVYGTLRRGASAHGMIEPMATSVVPAVLEGFALCGRGLRYPYVRPHAERQVRGDLVTLRQDGLALALDRLDRYEGDEYVRVAAPVRTESGEELSAWVYVAASHLELGEDTLIESGDWLEGGDR